VNDGRKRTATFDFGEFHTRFSGITFDVWVGSDDSMWSFAEHLEQIGSLREEVKADIVARARNEIDIATVRKSDEERTWRVMCWLAKTWVNWSQEDAVQALDHLADVCPAACNWLYQKTWQLIRQACADYIEAPQVIDSPDLRDASWWRGERR